MTGAMSLCTAAASPPRALLRRRDDHHIGPVMLPLTYDDVGVVAPPVQRTVVIVKPDGLDRGLVRGPVVIVCRSWCVGALILVVVVVACRQAGGGGSCFYALSVPVYVSVSCLCQR
jgi:hypothetical protein